MAKKQTQEHPYKCEFCKKGFKREGNFVKHSCKYKQRWLRKDEKYVKLAHFTYQKFYKVCFPRRKLPPTMWEFVCSKYYDPFEKFGKHLVDLQAIETEKFIDFVVKSDIKIDDWTKDCVYESFTRDLCKRETPERAVERSLNLLQQWSIQTGEEWTDFFRKISTNKAVLWIRNGKISPWLLYCASTSNELFDRFTDEQFELLEEYIDPRFWKRKMNNFKEETETIKEVFKETGI